ncbi:BtrH N-terminal domain-containing protein [Umezawaea endophytica]|uniref:BtrH N-terminal domain-containing protein n=1 Tax=Umezawaea endophytica TaxID=1654476 RepID=A0A9X2VPY9_9PSEU|nr:BtrH N-terminal domain-containing protein [Umezawaea endophytica]MCS7479303.1 BtrH N-terminal domain-containing protein [Umezawaea endophytica]
MTEWTLRGGTDPDSANLAALLAHQGFEGLSEALVFGVGGGIGAGYILFEFNHGDSGSRVVGAGFHNTWQYLGRRIDRTAERLGIAVDWHRTGGTGAAAGRLTAELERGRPCLVWPDRYHVGYWSLPEALNGFGGHSVVAYGEEGGRVLVDDRNLAPLTVDRADLDRARARVGTYKNALLVVTGEPHDVDLPGAVRAGLADVVEHLSKPSDSFSLPAWRKWGRMMTDERAAKAWPKVFADRVGLTDALLSTWECVEPAGMVGGNLRPLFADFLDEAAAVLDVPALADEAVRWRGIADRWHELAEIALPSDVPVVARLRDLTAAVTSAVERGDEGADDRAAAAEELWELRAAHASEPPFDETSTRDVFRRMGETLLGLHAAESAAIKALGEVRVG